MTEDTEKSRPAHTAWWRNFLEKSERWKAAHLSSPNFIDPSEAVSRLGQTLESWQGKLLVLTLPTPAQPCVPIWALPLFDEVTDALLGVESDAWARYLSLDTPNGMLNGAQPRKLLPKHLARALVCLGAEKPPKR